MKNKTIFITLIIFGLFIDLPAAEESKVSASCDTVIGFDACTSKVTDFAVSKNASGDTVINFDSTITGEVSYEQTFWNNYGSGLYRSYRQPKVSAPDKIDDPLAQAVLAISKALDTKNKQELDLAQQDLIRKRQKTTQALAERRQNDLQQNKEKKRSCCATVSSLAISAAGLAISFTSLYLTNSKTKTS